jgi:hypothetical protein
VESWEFLVAVTSGYVGLVVGYTALSRWTEGRRRDRRVKEWVQMVREQRRERSDGMDHWATRTWRERDKKE